MNKKSIRLIIITAIFTSVFTVGILTLTNTLAAINNPIYTRDELSEKVDDLEYDTGWVSLESYLVPPFENSPKYPVRVRRKRNTVMINGAVTNGEVEKNVTTRFLTNIPKEFRPSINVYYITSMASVNGFA